MSKFPNPLLLIEAIHESSEISQHNFLEKWSRTFFLRHTYPLASAIIAISEDVALDLRNNFSIKQNVKVIHYGLDLEHIRALGSKTVEHKWLSHPREFSTIVACGRLVVQKGFNVLLDAMCEVEDSVKLILVGDGEERAALNKQIQRLKLQERIDLVGYDRNPYKYMAKADIFIMPSLWEGFGLVLLEAIALGIPVIASDCPSGPRVILNNGECGILVPPDDYYALATSINQLINDNQLKQLTSAAFNRSEEFSAQKATKEYLNLFSIVGNW